MKGFDYYEDDEDESVDGLFGDRHSSVDKRDCNSDYEYRNFDKDRYNKDGNPKGWAKTKETW